MLSRDQRIEHISQWMGHLTIQRTWQSYKDRRFVHYHLPVSEMNLLKKEDKPIWKNPAEFPPLPSWEKEGIVTITNRTPF